jgi:hypothetical protein
MHIVTRTALAFSTVLIVGACAKNDQAAKDSAAAAAAAAATPTPAPPPAPLALADVAGKWQFRSVPEAGTDTTPTTFVLVATADTAGWVMTFPSGVKVPLQVMASGDSLVSTTGEFTSQRRKGAKVTTESVYRLQDGKLVGTTIAHYQKATAADSVLRLHSEGTKIP